MQSYKIKTQFKSAAHIGTYNFSFNGMLYRIKAS